MTRELGQSIGNVIELDPEEVNFQQKVEEWRDGEASYEDVRQSMPSHDLGASTRLARAFKNLDR